MDFVLIAALDCIVFICHFSDNLTGDRKPINSYMHGYNSRYHIFGKSIQLIKMFMCQHWCHLCLSVFLETSPPTICYITIVIWWILSLEKVPIVQAMKHHKLASTLFYHTVHLLPKWYTSIFLEQWFFCLQCYYLVP